VPRNEEAVNVLKEHLVNISENQDKDEKLATSLNILTFFETRNKIGLNDKKICLKNIILHKKYII